MKTGWITYILIVVVTVSCVLTVEAGKGRKPLPVYDASKVDPEVGNLQESSVKVLAETGKLLKENKSNK